MLKIKLEDIEAAAHKMKILLSLATFYFINKSYTLFFIINQFIACCLLAYTLYYYQNSFEKFADAFYNLNFSITSIVFAITGSVFKNEFHTLVEDSFCSYDYQSLIMRKKQEKVEKETAETLRRVSKGTFYFICIILFEINFLSFLESHFKNEEIYLLFPCWFPFELNGIILQILVFLWQETILLNIRFMGFGGVSILYMAYSNIKLQITLLKYAMKNIEERALEMAEKHKDFSQENVDPYNHRILSYSYYECTRMCAQHHSQIMTYFNTISTGSGIIYTAAFFAGILAVSFAGYFVISDNLALKTKYIGLSFFIQCVISRMFWMGDSTTNELMKISKTIYTMEWYNLPRHCQSTLRLMQLKSNKPLFYKTVLGQRVDMQGYMSMVKASYYYINMMIAK